MMRHTLPLALTVMLSLSALQSQAGPAGPFAGMAGSWLGAGSLTMANGTQERLRCRADYRVGVSGSKMGLGLRCASDSYNFSLVGDVASDGRAVYGSWSETTRNVSGTVSGRVSGDRIQMLARGDSFSASLSLVTHGNRQSVTISRRERKSATCRSCSPRVQPVTTGAAR